MSLTWHKATPRRWWEFWKPSALVGVASETSMIVADISPTNHSGVFKVIYAGMMFYMHGTFESIQAYIDKSEAKHDSLKKFREEAIPSAEFPRNGGENSTPTLLQ